MALRIQNRAMRRVGELLKQIRPAHGANQNIEDGAVPKVTRGEQLRMLDCQSDSARLLFALPMCRSRITAAVESPLPPLPLSWQRWELRTDRYPQRRPLRRTMVVLLKHRRSCATFPHPAVRMIPWQWPRLRWIQI